MDKMERIVLTSFFAFCVGTGIICGLVNLWTGIIAGTSLYLAFGYLLFMYNLSAYPKLIILWYPSIFSSKLTDWVVK